MKNTSLEIFFWRPFIFQLLMMILSCNFHHKKDSETLLINKALSPFVQMLLLFSSYGQLLKESCLLPYPFDQSRSDLTFLISSLNLHFLLLAYSQKAQASEIFLFKFHYTCKVWAKHYLLKEIEFKSLQILLIYQSLKKNQNFKNFVQKHMWVLNCCSLIFLFPFFLNWEFIFLKEKELY